MEFTVVNESPLPLMTVSHTLNNTFQIFNKNEMLVSIDLSTGKLQYGENYVPDHAAKIFWEAMSHNAPIHKNAYDTDHVLRQVRHILKTEEGTCVIERAKEVMQLRADIWPT
jgi:hypothetical protein